MIESQKIVKLPGPCRRTEKVVEHECDGNNNGNWSPWNILQESGKFNGWTGDQRKNRDHRDHNTAKFS